MQNLQQLQQLPPELYQRIARYNRNIYPQLAPLNSTLRQQITLAACAEPISGSEIYQHIASDGGKLALTWGEDDANLAYIQHDPYNGFLKLSVAGVDDFRILDYLLLQGANLNLKDKYAIYQSRQSCINRDPKYAEKMLARDFDRKVTEIYTDLLNHGGKYTTNDLTRVLVNFRNITGYGDVVYFDKLVAAINAGNLSEILKVFKRDADHLIELATA